MDIIDQLKLLEAGKVTYFQHDETVRLAIKEIERLRAAHTKIIGICLEGRLGALADAHGTATRALEHPDWNSYELGTDEQSVYTAANGEELPAGSSGTTIVNDGRPT